MASASKPIRTVSFIDSVVNEFTNYEQINERIAKFTFTSVQEWSGDWEGTNTFVGKAVVRDGFASGNVQAIGTFVGTVLGKEGTVTLMGRTIFREDGEFAIDQYTILSGTGELENIRGHLGHDETPPDFFNDYQVFWIHFDP